MSRLDVCVKTARPGLEIMSFWPSKSLKWLFFRHAVNKQYSLLSSLPPHCLPSCPHRGPVSLNITFPFIFHFLSMCFISTFFYFTVHTDLTSASSFISSTVETRQSYALWEICKSTQTFFFFSWLSGMDSFWEIYISRGEDLLKFANQRKADPWISQNVLLCIMTTVFTCLTSS